MHPELSKFPSNFFYESRLTDGPHMKEKRLAEWHNSEIFKPYVFFDVADGSEESKSKSYFNSVEINICVDIVKKLCSSYPHTQVLYLVNISFKIE
jgi:senataxin